MDLQDVKNLTIPEGSVKTIHDKDSRLLWGAVGYNIKYCGNTTQQTYSGKNLLNVPSVYAVSLFVNISVDLKANKTYTIQFDDRTTDATTNSYIRGSYDNTGYYLQANMSNNNKTAVVTPTSDVNLLSVYAGSNYANSVGKTSTFTNFMISEGSSRVNYEPYVGGTASPNPDYPQPVQVVTGTQTISITDGTNTQNFAVDLGSTELCKVGTYQDYIYKSGDDWYIHKATGRCDFSSSTPFVRATTKSFLLGYTATSPFYGLLALGDPSYQSFCNMFTFQRNGTTWAGAGKCGFNSGGAFWIMHTQNIDSVPDLQTWLDSNPTFVYYPLAAATETQIADSTLISQLNAIHEWLTRYGYNATVSGNLPIIIDRTAL